MALSQASKSKTLLSRLKPFFAVERLAGSSVEDGGRVQFSTDAGACSGSGQDEFPKWRKLHARNLGMARSMISNPSWTVLNSLRAAGFQAYLVGGCVRDLILNKVPKDFDVITTARLTEVKKTLRCARIVGRRFPICRVTLKGSVVEVSSFDTVAGDSKNKKVGTSQVPKGCDLEDFVRWKNSMKRDFTVNSLFYDPFTNVIFDYTNAIMDLRSMKLRTIIPAHVSFKEDEARILRGLRLAARLNLSFSKETEAAICSLSSTIAGLCKSRIHLEMNYMLSYGAAEPSLLLLKRFKLLEILLPFHAAYLSEQVENGLGLCSSMLMKLFHNMDQLITCDQPSCDSLWVAILTFHLALFSNPQQSVVLLTFASLLYLRTWEESITFARQNAQAIRMYVPEILDAFDSLSDGEIADGVTQFAQQVEKSLNVLTNTNCLCEAMTRFPGFPRSGLVFLSEKMGQRVKLIFQILTKDVTSIEAKRSSEIHYRLLAHGKVDEIRFVLGKIILGTLVHGTERGVTEVTNNGTRVINPSQKLEAFQRIQHRKLESMDKNKNDKRISPSNYEHDRLWNSATKTRSFENNRVVAEHRLRGKPGGRSPNSSLDEILRGKHMKADEKHSNLCLLSGLFG